MAPNVAENGLFLLQIYIWSLLTSKKCSSSFFEEDLCLFIANWNPKRLSRSLIGWEICDFSRFTPFQVTSIVCNIPSKMCFNCRRNWNLKIANLTVNCLQHFRLVVLQKNYNLSEMVSYESFRRVIVPVRNDLTWVF